jgi:predicted amidohydrolase YtcJ
MANLDHQLSYLREQIDIQVRAGFDNDWDVLIQVEDQVRDELRDTDGAEVEGLLAETRQRLADQRQRETTWTELTMNDRIDRAFMELNQRGIVALQDAGYTMSDGWEDIAEAQREQPGAWGGTFCHRQDVERGVRGEGLMLTFGAFAADDRHEPESLRLAREVCSTLEQHGVATAWDGTLAKRIQILPFEWRKRRSTAPPR